jgi:hypothetical protein
MGRVITAGLAGGRPWRIRWQFGPLCVWVPETGRVSCDLLILVNEAADAIVSLDLVMLGCCVAGEWS